MSAQKDTLEHPNAALLSNATKGFDYLFSNDIVSARKHFEPHDDPFHMLGLGVCAFLEAALGMEAGLMTEATRCLAVSEAGTRKQMRAPKPRDMAHESRFAFGMEWEILNADAVVLLGLTNALSESYMGYLQCMYSLNSAHSKFTKLYKTVFPAGLPSTLDSNSAPASPTLTTKGLSVSSSLQASLAHKASATSLSSQSSASSAASAATHVQPPAARSGFFSRWVGTASEPVLPLIRAPDGPVEDLIIAGTAFGFGLFNLVFSLLPKKVQGLVGFFGFKHDRKLALQALALAATKEDVHGVFAGLVLMTYHGVVLLLSGYQADEERLLKEYKAIVDKVESRYPQGALWILNRAKILRMAYDAEGAILVLQEGLKPNRPHSFAQADMLLIFELAWTLLGQRRYLEAAETFMKITELNSWSHGTYYFIAAGCHLALGDMVKAQAMMDGIPALIDRKKMSGKDLPTEVYIKKKLAFYKEKQMRRTGSEANWIQAVKVNPAEEIGIFWNTHARIAPSIAQAHIDDLTTLTPPATVHKITLESPTTPSIRRESKQSLSSRSKISLESLKVSENPASPISPSPYSALVSASSNSAQLQLVDLDTPDELAIRALLLGINYRTTGEFDTARGFFVEAHGYPVVISTWVSGISMFELAVLDLREAEARTGNVRHGRASLDHSHVISPLKFSTISEDEKKTVWIEALRSASEKLEVALGLAGSNVDLSSRLDSRIAMLRDEIAAKKEMVGVNF